MENQGIQPAVPTRERRHARVDRAAINEAERTVELAFSSEAPVDRPWGIEVLGHAPGEVDMSWISGGSAPLLLDHSTRQQIGVVVSATVDPDLKGRCIVRVSRNPDGEAVLRDLQDGIKSNVSVGYEIIASTEERGAAGAPTRYRVTRWKPLEVSIVAIPADMSVGVGRHSEPDHPHAQVDRAPPPQPQEVRMDQITSVPAQAVTHPQSIAPAHLVTDEASVARRNNEIMYLANLVQQREAGTDAILRDISVEAFRGELLLRRAKDGPIGTPASEIGMSQSESRKYSLTRAMRALASRDWGQAGLEAEASAAVAKRMGRDPEGVFIPMEVQRRDLSAGTASAGGYLVETVNGGDFISQLRNRSVLRQMGATVLSGLQGNVTIPKQTGPATAYWLGSESTAATESQQTFGQMSLVPRNVAAYTEVSRQLLMQSDPSADLLVMSDLAQVVALAVDAAGMAGSGTSGQPLGIHGQSGVGAVTGTSIAYAGIVQFQTIVAAANALRNPAATGYVCPPAVAGLLVQRQRFASTDTALWDGGIFDGRMAGFRAMSSMNAPAATLLFGDFSQVVIAEWGALDISMNPYANFAAGISGFRAFYSVDIGVRYAASFALAGSVT